MIPLTNEQLTEEVIRLEKTQAAQQEQIKTLSGALTGRTR